MLRVGAVAAVQKRFLVLLDSGARCESVFSRVSAVWRKFGAAHPARCFDPMAGCFGAGKLRRSPGVSWQCWESLLAPVGSRGGHKARVSNPNGCHEDKACWWPPVALLAATRWAQGHGECQSHSWSCWVVQQSSSPGCSPALFREEARMPKELLGHHHLVPSRGAPPAAHASSSGCSLLGPRRGVCRSITGSIS